ncbi:MAG: hypothetical protein ACD_49C00066G0009 [uncultured bacterium (gcode 4)]|uniref:Uncharacterized protein n=1 Tax=uncultured bacterium (gcode 4) TaxID=1234023 RepID=K2ADH2_9BACT|nr:MAG: hypothetical protein ACD_49C00066G0009 [uncultured bacterium (gcode 4)]
MELKRGTSRLSFVGNKYTLKLPLIDFRVPWLVYKIIYWSYKEWRSFKLTERLLKNNILNWFRHNLDNIKGNLIEYRLWKKYPKVVMKTRISVFWLLNIQDSWKTISNEESQLLWDEIINVFWNHNNATVCWHAFYDQWDFARDIDWNIKLIDAWSKKLERILEIEWENLFNAMRKFKI